MRPVPPPTDPDKVILARLGRWLRLARWALLWEQLWPLVLPPLCLLGLFVALALFDVLPLLPGWLHALILAAVAGGAAFLGMRAVLRLRRPNVEEAARRLERDSGLLHRPLSVLADRPVSGNDPLTEALWQIHRRRMAAVVRQLRLALPHPNMAARDPWGLRAAVLLLLVIAATVAGEDWRRRLGHAVAPGVGSAGLGPDALEVWITPPAYTALAPILLKPDAPAPGVPVTVPVGSTVLAVLAGGWGTARLVVDGDATRFQRQPDGTQRLETQMRAGHRLAVRQAGMTVAAWSVAVAADATPSIGFAVPPEEGERGRLRMAVTASDDHGLAKAWVNIHRLAGPPDEDPLVVELPLPNGRPRSAEMASWHDLTAHPWAGLPVTMQPAAVDAIGQTGTGEALTVTLPERGFTNPVAAALVDVRRQLTETRANAPGAMGVLDGIAVDPDLFNDDLKTFLMLRTARHALDDGNFQLAEVQDLLWNAALRIEDGDLSSAERSLEEARRELEKAVDEGAGAEELQRLLDQFQQAMQRYMDAVAERMDETPPLPGSDDRVLGADELQQMVEGMREMAETGSREALKQMLQDLSQILDGLQVGVQQQANEAGNAGIQQLREVARKQQEFLDQSHRQAVQDSGSEASGAKAADAQTGLRSALGEAARKLGEGLGEVPPALSEADQAMADAAGDLGQGQWGNAAEAQAQALRLIQKAAREALEQMGAAGQGAAGLVPRDPLGRPSRGSGGVDDGTTRVPDRAEVQRSHDLLNEIRRRSGEVERPRPERDYLQRLLKQF